MRLRSEDVRKLCQQGRLEEALHIFDAMKQQGIRPQSSTYASILQLCVDKRALQEGKLIHAQMINTGFSPQIFLGTKLVTMYVKCGCLSDARQLFDEMPKRNVVSWTAMIVGYAKHGYDEDSLKLYYQMQREGIQPNEFTLAGVLPACANLAGLRQGKEVHEDIARLGFQSDVFIGSALVDMYAKCGSVEDAHQVFDEMPERNIVSWNALIAGYVSNGNVIEALKLFQKIPQRDTVSWTAMIAAYAQHGFADESLSLFRQMQLTEVKADSVTFSIVLPACADLAALIQGEQAHGSIIRSGLQSSTCVATALVDVYAKCGSIEEAHQVFEEMPERNVVSWNALIAGYAQNGYVDKALNIFQKMLERDMVSWNAMIAGYAQNGHFNLALKLFRQMQGTGVAPDSVTFTSILPACANLAALTNGKEVHQNTIRSGHLPHISVGSGLVDMYAKCGRIEDACHVFDKIPEPDIVSWNAMIVGYAKHGRGNEALQLFKRMECSNMKPNHVTFIGVLSACSHAGLVDDGWQYFHRMKQDYHITPAVEHCCCMVDLLGRAGCLDVAQDFINKMPVEPNAIVWRSLLAACRIHNNIELGEHVAEHLLELDSKNAACYVLMSNIYAAGRRWDDVQKVRKLMKARKVKKNPGCSWIEVNNKVYTFFVGDRSHPQADKIYAELERLFWQMEEAGYVPNTNLVLHDVEQEQKQHMLWHHSEKLAIAFGIIHAPPGTPIRIMKNLRVCSDCHSAIKFISMLAAREIVVRDANRFHHFKNGQCSCGDYW